MIFVGTFKMIMSILNNFGDMIYSIEIFFVAFDGKKGTEIMKNLNENAFESLKTLGLYNCKGEMLNELKNPFKNLTKLSFTRSDNHKLKLNDAKTMNKCFPNLISLQLQNVREFVYFNGIFSSLKSLKLRNYDVAVNVQAIDFLKRHPHLKIFKTRDTNQRVLKQLNEFLPETLKLILLIENSTYQGNAIHLNTIKDLVIIGVYDKAPEKLYFDHVESIAFTIRDGINGDWLPFLKNQLNSNVKAFAYEFGYLNKDVLLGIPEALPNLNTIKIRTYSNYTVADIVTFLQKTKKLVHFDLQFYFDGPNLTLNTFTKEIGNQWNVSISTNNPRINRIQIQSM